MYASTATLLLAFTALLSPVLAQNLTGLPECAQDCFIEYESVTSCDLTNATCLCADATFTTDVEDCVATTCDSTDIATALAWEEEECGS